MVEQTSQVFETCEVSVRTSFNSFSVNNLSPLCPSLKGGGENGVISKNNFIEKSF